jgi:hypothetical protein
MPNDLKMHLFEATFAPIFCGHSRKRAQPTSPAYIASLVVGKRLDNLLDN